MRNIEDFEHNYLRQFGIVDYTVVVFPKMICVDITSTKNLHNCGNQLLCESINSLGVTMNTQNFGNQRNELLSRSVNALGIKMEPTLERVMLISYGKDSFIRFDFVP